jgi:hypothetical protein
MRHRFQGEEAGNSRAWALPVVLALLAAPRAHCQPVDVVRRHGIDPSSPLEARVKETPASVLKMFKEIESSTPTHHPLTKSERLQLSAAFAALPPLHRRILSERLRCVSFLDGMPNTALTSTVNPGEPFLVFDITIRAAILRQNVSEWLTEKERTCFDSTASPLSVAVEAGKRDAIAYALLHEATHVVDSSLRITPKPPSGKAPADRKAAGLFANGVWRDQTTALPQYRDPLLERLRYRVGGAVLPIKQAEAVYAALQRTPFVSLYASSNWFDDLAEYVAVYHFTEVLKQPFRIVVHREGKEVFAYEPMRSDLVRRRINRMKQFYIGKNEIDARMVE